MVTIFIRMGRGELISRLKLTNFSVTQHISLIEVYMDIRTIQHVGYIGLGRDVSDSSR